MSHCSTYFLGLTLACFVAAAPAAAQSRFSFDTTPGNLSREVVPTRYVLALDLDPARDRFSGRAQIHIRVRSPVAAITLHAHDLKAGAVRLVSVGAPERRLEVRSGKPPESWALEPSDGAPIAEGDYVLDIAYDGKVQSTDAGVFRVDYRAQDRRERMLATQLQAVFARRVFPCFDEPAFRAAFELSVTAPAQYEVVSNMPAVSRTVTGERALHGFSATPPMPSYLFAVAVGQFDQVSGNAADVPLRILTARGKAPQAAFALDATRQVLPYFAEYFGVPYSLPKLDQLAVPAVREGAMEDWGLISYSEDLLLYDPARSAPRTRQNVYETIAHEISHQWFGNLVTAASWNEIWLNEAFATWIAEKATDHFNPDFRMALRHRLEVDRTMNRDSTPGSRAIRAGPVSEASVFDVFDSITYIKGGAMLSMLEQWIGADAFRRGLTAYMSAQKFSNATDADLWYFMGQASGKDVARVAASWTNQEGLPVVRVETSCAGGDTVVSLTQRRFSLGPTELPPATWLIPVVLTRGDERRTVLLDSARGSAQMTGCSDVPVLANPTGIGYYRVEYLSAEVERLANRFAALPATDRIALLSDQFALMQAGGTSPRAYFTLLAQLPSVRDDSRTVLFSMAAGALETLNLTMAGTPTQAKIAAAGRALLGPELKRLGWDAKPGEDYEDARLRSALIRRLARFGDPEVIAEAKRRFAAAQSADASLPAATRADVLYAVGTNADRAQFDRLLAQLRSATDEEDRWTYARALAAGNDDAQAREVLAVALDMRVPANVAIRIPSMVATQSPHGAMAYDYVLAKWPALAERAGDMFGAKSWLLPGAAEGFNDSVRARKLVSDQRERLGSDGEATARQVAAGIDVRAMVRTRDAVSLDAALGAWQPRP